MIVILGLMLLVTVPSITKTLKNKKEEEYNRFLNDLYLATESYVGMHMNCYAELVYGNKAVVELKELIDAGYISGNKINPKTKEKINPLETVLVTKKDDGTYSYALSGKENGISSYVKDGLLLWLDGKNHGESEYMWKDLSGNGNHGTLKGFHTNSSKLWDKNSLYFDGVDDIVTTKEINPSSAVTVEATVELQGDMPLTHHYNIIGNWQNGGYGLAFEKDQSVAKFSVYVTEYSMLLVPNKAQTKVRMHIVGRYDGTKQSLWINGVKQSLELELSGNIGVPERNTVLAIGANPYKEEIEKDPNIASASHMKAYSARVYGRALSDSEIQKNYEIEKMRFGI